MSAHGKRSGCVMHCVWTPLEKLRASSSNVSPPLGIFYQIFLRYVSKIYNMTILFICYYKNCMLHTIEYVQSIGISDKKIKNKKIGIGTYLEFISYKL